MIRTRTARPSDDRRRTLLTAAPAASPECPHCAASLVESLSRGSGPDVRVWLLSLALLLWAPGSTAQSPPPFDTTPARPVVVDAPIYGLDVSHHQGIIDWARVAGTGHRFTFIKATEGLDWSDPRFAVNWRDSGYAGLLRGAYHFFHANDDPDRQADAFLAVYDPSPGDLPPVVDVETTDDVEPTVLVARVERFLDLLEQATGRRPFLYTAPRFWTDLGVEAPSAALWVAEYGVRSPDLPRGWQRWTFWQETQRGRLPGVPKPVDLNVFAGTLHELEALRLGPIPKALPIAVPVDAPANQGETPDSEDPDSEDPDSEDPS